VVVLVRNEFFEALVSNVFESNPARDRFGDTVKLAY
jgi:hypothetical protein